MLSAPHKVALTIPGGILVCALLFSACSERSTQTSTTPPKQVRGEPINSVPSPGSLASATPPGLPLSAPKTDEKIGNYSLVGFEKLGGYTFNMPNETAGPATNQTSSSNSESSIPVTLRALNNQPVAIKGFMLPLKVHAGAVTEMLIMKDQSMCCYGTVPRINDWVSVKMKDKGVRPIMDQPVTLFGTLHVGEMRENGYLVGIYELNADKMEAPEE